MSLWQKICQDRRDVREAGEHPDYLGSTSLQTDQNGNQIQHFEYSAFGQTRYTQSTNVFKVSRLYREVKLDK